MFSVIILAAGKSTRMGCLKQLLQFGEQTMIERVVLKYLQPFAEEVLVVVGHEREKVAKGVTTKDPRLKFVFNPYYEQGMGTSIAAAVKQLSKQSQGAMLALADMPVVEDDTIMDIFRFWTKDKEKIVIPRNGERKGHPVIFPNLLYAKLESLNADRGASSVIRENIESVTYYETSDRGIVTDADTPEMLAEIKNRIGQ